MAVMLRTISFLSIRADSAMACNVGLDPKGRQLRTPERMAIIILKMSFLRLASQGSSNYSCTRPKPGQSDNSASAQIDLRRNANAFTWTVRTTRGETRQGDGCRRLPEAGS